MPDLPPLSAAGEHFGRAFCTAASEAGVPFAQLPPDEQACITTVGRRWEADIDQKMGVGAPPPAPEVYRATLQGTNGPVGTLTYADGTVTLCWNPPPSGTAGPRCQVLGSGFDAFRTAQTLLRQFGLQTVDLD
jgi:hypothetical protein